MQELRSGKATQPYRFIGRSKQRFSQSLAAILFCKQFVLCCFALTYACFLVRSFLSLSSFATALPFPTRLGSLSALFQVSQHIHSHNSIKHAASVFLQLLCLPDAHRLDLSQSPRPPLLPRDAAQLQRTGGRGTGEDAQQGTRGGVCSAGKGERTYKTAREEAGESDECGGFGPQIPGEKDPTLLLQSILLLL